MKTTTIAIVAFAMLTAVACRAELISFGISPAGSDAAVGLSPANEVPGVTNSTGAGGTISGGIVFDTDTSILQLAVGYGSAAGFADLTGPATDITLNGPAGTNSTAPVLADLFAFNFPATNAASGGVVFGTVTVSSNAVADLLAGNDYLNIATAANPMGEIRGQLIALTPVLSCPAPATIQCGSNFTETVTVSDPQGLALTVVWSVNDVPMQTNMIAAGSSTNTVAFTSDLPQGTNILQVVATDSSSNSASCSTTIVVADTIPPVIVAASATPNVLWPPNHKFVKVTIHATVTDNCGPTTWRIVSVESNEAVNAKGSGNTAPDWQILSAHTVDLRAERSGTGSGRIYSITIQATDEAGNLSETAVVTVTVPKSQGQGNGNDQGNGNANGNGHGNGNGNGKGNAKN